jgi:hypothetical protein
MDPVMDSAHRDDQADGSDAVGVEDIVMDLQ